MKKLSQLLTRDTDVVIAFRSWDAHDSLFILELDPYGAPLYPFYDFAGDNADSLPWNTIMFATRTDNVKDDTRTTTLTPIFYAEIKDRLCRWLPFRFIRNSAVRRLVYSELFDEFIEELYQETDVDEVTETRLLSI